MPWGVYTIYLHNILCVERQFTIDVASMLILAFGVGAGLGSTVAGMLCNYLYVLISNLDMIMIMIMIMMIMMMMMMIMSMMMMMIMIMIVM